MIGDDPTGPAPERANRAFEPVETDLVPVDAPGDGSLRAWFQPWVDSGAIFVAWEIGGVTGRLGTAALPDDAGWPDPPPVGDADAVVWLGERGVPAGDGRHRGWVAFDGLAADVREFRPDEPSAGFRTPD